MDRKDRLAIGARSIALLLRAALVCALAAIVPLAAAQPIPPPSPGCIWSSGPYDQRTAQLSISDPYLGEQQTADDIFIEPGCIAHIVGITATLLGNGSAPKARLRIYEECDGKPGTELFAMDTVQLTDTGRQLAGLEVYSVRFSPPALWLDGGKVYWVSVMGIATQPTEQWAWATARGGVIAGSPGAFRATGNGVPNWVGVDTLGCGCTDFTLGVEGECCKVLWDNGPPDAAGTGYLSIVDGTSIGARAADDFETPTCEDVTVCFARAVMYSNCTPFEGTLALYTGTCNLPDVTPVASAPFSRVIDLGYNVTIGSRVLRAYEVRVHEPGWALARGKRYWLAAVGQGGGTVQQRAYFAFARGCDTCTIRLGPGVAVGASTGFSVWTPMDQLSGTRRDFSFMIAVREPGASGGATPACLADFNRDGTLNAQDLFDFLGAWFAGCP